MGAQLAKSEPEPVTQEQMLARAEATAAAKTLAAGQAAGGCRFMLCDPTQRLAVLGLAPGVIFFLRCMLEGCFTFALIFAIQWPLQSDILRHTSLRDDCRTAFANEAEQPMSLRALQECGYDDHNISTTIAPLLGLARFCYNGCEEFADEVWYGAPWLVNFAGATVDTDGAIYCPAGGITMLTLIYWYADLLLILCYVVRLRYLETHVEEEADKHTWTTADYAVLLTGLDRQQELTRAVQDLSKDLKSLGFLSHVHHMEMGLMPEPSSAEELKQGGAPPEERTTGHAFIVFHYEEDRNRLLKLASHNPTSFVFMRAAAKRQGQGVTACAGPEPSNVLWENLHVEPEERRRRFWMTQRAIGVVLAVATVMLASVQFFKRTFTQDFDIGGGDHGYLQQLLDPSVDIALLSALIIAVLAWKVRNTIKAFHSREGHPTRGEFETGLLAKLSWAFTTNNVIMPIVVSMAQAFVSEQKIIGQNFYERTGFPTMALVIISIQRVTADLPRALQLVSVIKRCRMRFKKDATAEELASAWDPPGMALSLQMAQFYWLIACALLYGPFAPFYYGLASVWALWSFTCTKCGVLYWYKRMPAIPSELGRMLRQMILALLPAQLLLKLAVRWAAEPKVYQPALLTLFAGGCGLVAVALRSPLARGSGGGDGDGGDGYQSLSELDTDGISYNEVQQKKGYPIDCYINPFRRTQTELRAPSRGDAFFGEPAATKPSAADSSAETIDHNIAVISTAIPFDELPSSLV